MLLLENFLEPPIAKSFWIQHFPSMCFRSLYMVVKQCHLPSICVSLNYRMAKHTIFSLLLRMGKIQDSTCLSCHTGPEDMFHLWVTCPWLINFKSVFLSDKQHTIIIHFTNLQINTKKLTQTELCLFTVHKYAQYAFTYYKMNNKLHIFIQYFIMLTIHKLEFKMILFYCCFKWFLIITKSCSVLKLWVQIPSKENQTNVKNMYQSLLSLILRRYIIVIMNPCLTVCKRFYSQIFNNMIDKASCIFVIWYYYIIYNFWRLR